MKTQFDDWRQFEGKGFDDRICARLDWSKHQREFYICADCGRLHAQNDRPIMIYDVCWNCTLQPHYTVGVRSWLEMFWVQFKGAA